MADLHSTLDAVAERQMPLQVAGGVLLLASLVANHFATPVAVLVVLMIVGGVLVLLPVVALAVLVLRSRNGS